MYIIYIEKNWPHKSSHFLCKRRETTEIDTALNLLYEAIQLFSNWVLNDKFTRSNQLLIVMSRPSYRLSDFWIGLVLRSYISCTFTTETLKKNTTKLKNKAKQNKNYFWSFVYLKMMGVIHSWVSLTLFIYYW